MDVIACALFVAGALLLIAALRGRRRRPTARPAPAKPAPRRRRRPNRHQTHYGYHYLHATPGRGRRYIGIGVRPEDRHRDHERKWWFPSCTGVQYVVAEFPDWWAARAWEREEVIFAAQRGEPIVNIEHNPHARRRARV